MSIFAQQLQHNNILHCDIEWFVPLSNKIYDAEVNEGRIIKHSKYDVNCDYALIHSNKFSMKDMKQATGFACCFPKKIGSEKKRIIVFHDLILPEFISFGVAHEYAHLKGGDEKDAFAFELQIAKKAKKELEYLAYNEKEYPRRIKHFKEFGLIK